jgi:hypothetical protein
MGDRLEKMLGEGVKYIEHDSTWVKNGKYRTGECTVNAPTGKFFLLFNHPMTGVDTVDGESL